MGSCCTGQQAWCGEQKTQINLGAGQQQDPDKKGEEQLDENLVKEKATKIQAHIRGHKAREEVKKIKETQKSSEQVSDKCIKQSLEPKRMENHQLQEDKASVTAKEAIYTKGPEQSAGANQHAPNDRVRKIEKVPDFLTDRTRQVLEKLDEFVYDQDQEEYKDLPHLGPYEFENGSVYIGQWKNGQRHGRGKQIWQDGSLYEGYWYQNVACGKGRLIHSDGDIYEGEWRNDKAHGQGKYVHMDGAQYIGQWEDDRQNGEGQEIWPDGASYQGQYKNGKKDGRGTFKWADGSIYVGDFYQNNIQGQGEYSWEDGRKYVGEWKNNKMDGKGVFTWLDGRRYEGQYKDDKKHGYGEFKWPDGRVYKGEWSNGKQHGKGIYIGSSKVEKEGEWQDGKRVRWIKRGGQPIEEGN
ncbi:unnamed protein product [Paramecium pentaurelia]|uniref:MORN repeat protein n=1 Tax=Paramecium pentaurelia TaxID=43138 RepID=A0A8S1X3T3_9CILI|nr:unnamed protein product [Paramecium pentaurelia]